MSRDSSYNHLHLSRSAHADFSDEFSRPALSFPELQISPEHQPPNPEDEDDVVPDQHAAYGIQRATQRAREPEWRDLGLAELLAREGRRGGALAGGTVNAGGNAAGASTGAGAAEIANRDGQGTRDMIRASLARREAAQGSMARGAAARGTNG